MTVKPNKRRYAIGYFLLTGWTPWGVDLAYGNPDRRTLVEVDGRWIMCCGHVLSSAEIEAWFAAGLIAFGEPTVMGGRTAVAGERLAEWISGAWFGLQARRWAR